MRRCGRLVNTTTAVFRPSLTALSGPSPFRSLKGLIILRKAFNHTKSEKV